MISLLFFCHIFCVHFKHIFSFMRNNFFFFFWYSFRFFYFLVCIRRTANQTISSLKVFSANSYFCSWLNLIQLTKEMKSHEKLFSAKPHEDVPGVRNKRCNKKPILYSGKCMNICIEIFRFFFFFLLEQTTHMWIKRYPLNCLKFKLLKFKKNLTHVLKIKFLSNF